MATGAASESASECNDLILVGNLATHPAARVIPDPRSVLKASGVMRQSIAATWRSTVSLAA